MTPPAERLAAALADRYRIERELGQGGMATVYLAEDVKHHRRVAVKVLKPELGVALGAERFLREIEVAAGLRHPHILPLYDSGDAAGLLYYVMPYVEGETLRARMDRERQLPMDEALRIAREVADALAYAHAHGVVHRDIKPENILLEAGHAVVADFGIAKAIASAGDATALTLTGMSVGTPSYMSPEQAAGDPTVDGRSDLYSLGCVLYEMLAGVPPFTGPTVESLVRQHITAPAPPVTQFRPTVPVTVADAIGRALAKNPADRFNPVDQFGTALQLRTSTAAEVASSPAAARRHLPWIVAAAVTLVILSGVAWLGLRGGGASREASIAVLPLRLIAGDTSSNALALGIQAELITQLTHVRGLRVASRGAMREYVDSDKPERQVAQELGVATILSGDIQRAGDQVRLTMSLSDPHQGAELWAERFDRELTTGNIFAVQAEIARAVAEALRLQLTTGVADSAPPTQNLAALELFYRAEAIYEGRGDPEGDALALDLAERAVRLDPGFLRGWSLVTRIRSWRVRTGDVRDVEPSREAMERTRALGPESIEARLAEGYYRYYIEADFSRALAAMDAAASLEPRSSDLLQIRALLNRRLGNWDTAVRQMQEAVALEPRDGNVLSTLGETQTIMRQYDQAAESFRRAVEVAPTGAFAHVQRVLGLLQVRGDTAAARRTIGDIDPILPPFGRETLHLTLAVYTRDLDAARRITFTAQQNDQVQLLSNLDHRHLQLATLARAVGRPAVARAHADSLRVVALRESGRAGADPFRHQVVVELNHALADALAGRVREALARADAAAALIPVEEDRIEATFMRRLLAAVYALTGKHTEAVAMLEEQLAQPGWVHPGELRLDPLWDDLRDKPEFQALMARTSVP
jgi:serine/threonine-protein kinase